MNYFYLAAELGLSLDLVGLALAVLKSFVTALDIWFYASFKMASPSSPGRLAIALSPFSRVAQASVRLDLKLASACDQEAC